MDFIQLFGIFLQVWICVNYSYPLTLTPTNALPLRMPTAMHKNDIFKIKFRILKLQIISKEYRAYLRNSKNMFEILLLISSEIVKVFKWQFVVQQARKCSLHVMRQFFEEYHSKCYKIFIQLACTKVHTDPYRRQSLKIRSTFDNL